MKFRINIENCVRCIPEDDAGRVWQVGEFVKHAKQLRDRAIAGDDTAIGEFFDLYRFSDNQGNDDWRKVTR